MSTTGIKRPLNDALRDAEAFRALFPASTYLRWEIAGSVRRKKPEVSDVEHVVIPAHGEVEMSGGLFATTERVCLLWHRLDELVAQGEVKKHIYGTTGFRWGEKYRGVEFRGYLHELFAVDADNWGAQLLIRTGPADYSERIVSIFKHGGMYRQQDGYLKHIASGEVVKVPDEETYLRMAGLRYVEPERRM